MYNAIAMFPLKYNIQIQLRVLERNTFWYSGDWGNGHPTNIRLVYDFFFARTISHGELQLVENFKLDFDIAEMTIWSFKSCLCSCKTWNFFYWVTKTVLFKLYIIRDMTLIVENRTNGWVNREIEMTATIPKQNPSFIHTSFKLFWIERVKPHILNQTAPREISIDVSFQPTE